MSQPQSTFAPTRPRHRKLSAPLPLRDVVAIADTQAQSQPVRASTQTVDKRIPGPISARPRLRSGLLWLAALTILVGGLVLAVPTLHGLANELGRLGGWWIWLLLALEVLSCLGYVLCFQLVFSDVKGRFGAKLALAELAFGAVVPLGGAGSLALGGWVLHERGMPVARVAERSAALFLLTSAVNVCALTLGAASIATGASAGPSDWLLTTVPALCGLLVLTLFSLLPRLCDRVPARHGRLNAWLRPTAAGVRAVAQLVAHPSWRLVGALGYLGFDIAVLWLTLLALRAPMPVAVVLVAYLVGYLANLIPVPGGIGAVDAGLAGALIVYGVHPAEAAAAVLIYRAISLWVPATIGALAFATLGHGPRPSARTRRKLASLTPPPAELVAVKSPR